MPGSWTQPRVRAERAGRRSAVRRHRNPFTGHPGFRGVSDGAPQHRVVMRHATFCALKEDSLPIGWIRRPSRPGPSGFGGAITTRSSPDIPRPARRTERCPPCRLLVTPAG